MSIDAMSVPTLFDFVPTDPSASTSRACDPPACDASAIDPPAHPPPPENDAAPTRIGAGVHESANAPESTTTNGVPSRRRVRVRATSREAYRSIGPAAVTQAARILIAHQQRGAEGLTDDEGQDETGIKTQSYTPRRGELVEGGLIVKSGRERPTASGRMAIVWVASPEVFSRSKSNAISKPEADGAGGSAA